MNNLMANAFDSEFSQKFLWIELIGFDNESPDFAVGDLLSRMEIIPQGISLLIWCTELIHSHTNLSTDAPIGAKHCAYWARSRNEERARQDWSKFQLKKLVALLQERGIDVYVSFFDQLMSDEKRKSIGLPAQTEWIDKHPEIRCQLCDGTIVNSICPYKRLADNSLYEDFFFAQLERFLLDYNFNGLHCADGFAHPRVAIGDGDFSADMIQQFCEAQKIQVPDGDIESRSQWILSNARRQWVEFHGWRQANFWRKGMKMLERNNLKHLFNSCWTRDPLEAKFRYGIDYNLLTEAGVKSWIIEAQAAVVETEGWNHSPIPMQDFYRAMVLRMKAFMPDAALFLLHCVKDGLEQYNVLRHAPTFMDSDLLSLRGLVCTEKLALDGAMTCLADGIRREEWRRLDRTYKKSVARQPQKLPWPVVLWSDQAFQQEFEAYCRQPQCSSFRTHAGLLSCGAVLPAIVSIDDLKTTEKTPLIIFNPGFFPSEELQEAYLHSDGNLAQIGLFADGEFACRIYNNSRLLEEFSAELGNSLFKEVSTWLEELPEKMPQIAFFEKAACAINRHFAEVRPATIPSAVRLCGFYEDNKSLRLLITNEKRIYQRAELSLKGIWSLVEVLSPDELILPPALRYVDGDSTLNIKLPPSGTIPLILQKTICSESDNKE